MDVTVESMEREGDRPWELPEGWCWAPLGQIVDIHDHRRRPIKSEDRQKRIENKRPNELFPYYGATGKVGVIDGYLFDFPSILLGEDGAPFLDRQRNKAYFVEGKYWVNNHAHIITPRASTITGWLLHALNFIDYEPHVGGTTRLKLTKADLERIPLPLAPLAEQRRIVARVDALFAEIAEGEAALEAARKGLDTFRRALLKAAVTGELTKDWRETNPVTETGHDLLARIKADRAAKGQAKGRGKRTADAPPLDTAALPELPEGWAWATLESVGEIVSGQTPAGIDAVAQTAGEIPWFKVSSMNDAGSDGMLTSSNWYLSSIDAKKLGLRILPTSAICFPKRGGSILTNKKRRLGVPGALDLNVMAFVADASISDYAWIFFLNLDLKTIFDGSNVPQINYGDIAYLPIAIPPPAEAAEILRRVSEALAASADTLTMLDAEAADAARLKQSILKAAFEGRLVPQDPADEPASPMLARLKATASTAGPAKRGRARKSAP